MRTAIMEDCFGDFTKAFVHDQFRGKEERIFQRGFNKRLRPPALNYDYDMGCDC